MTFEQQYDIFWKNLTTRKRSPAKPATLNSYSSYWRTWIGPLIGQLETGAVENGVMKKFVAELSEAGLSPASIAGITQLVKNIVKSAVDENGNALFPRVWRSDFIDQPIVNRNEQRTPTITALEVSRAISAAPSQYGPLLALTAATGARISEILAIKGAPQSNSSYWDVDGSKLVIRKALYRGLEQATKTQAGTREVDLSSKINEYLKKHIVRTDGYLFSNDNKPLRIRTAYDVIEKLNVPGYHSLRRFRISHLENQGVPGGLARFWTGHSSRDVHEGYIKLDKNIQARKDWCERAGLGFTL